ncbi:MAG TPA: cation-translocating P-type ATPase [Verrucomicrobiae bacterium]|nr:cation-translocating P-type ATPase [Verrucomicrobiae bacterium]
MQTPSAARTELSVAGMTCSGCARTVTDALQGVPGVASAAVSLETKSASVRWNPQASTSADALVRAVAAAGYQARPIAEAGAAASPKDTAAQTWGVNVLTGIIPTALLLLGDWGFGWHDSPAFRWIAFALATVVLLGPGRHFYQGAWRQLRIGSSNMDTLVALGSTTAYAFSAWVQLAGRAEHLYFTEAAAIITLISVGHWIEARVSARASSSLRALMNLAPALALRLDPGGVERSAPVAELLPGDTVLLKPGDRIPTDGYVLEGTTAVDESMLTGESMPVEKGPGAQLFAGTLNQSGRVPMRVTSTGEGTALAQIIAAVQRAQSSRANIQRLGDRVSSVFVPVVVLVALAAALWWGFWPEQAWKVYNSLAPAWWHSHPPTSPLAGAVFIASAVLIIACPCAMGLATPAAIMAGSNAAAARGILIRDGVALEKAGEVTAVLFDKTGTLTAGKPAVIGTETFDGALRAPRTPSPPSEGGEGRGEEGSSAGFGRPLTPALSPSDGERETRRGATRDPSPLELAAALARHSTHPLSQAVAKSHAGDLALEDWLELRGAGVQARWRSGDGASHQVRLGSLRWLGTAGVDCAPAQSRVAEWTDGGATVLGLAIDDSLAAVIALNDTLKPGARAVVERLHAHGLKTFLVTGDNLATARSIAAQAGIEAENVFAEVRPEDKAELVKKLQQQGDRVAFVGDGINDAPALEQANLGVAVSRASDVAREAADIILLKSEIEAVPEALGLARATLRTIKQNLFWAFFYNAAAIPLAALGFISPVLCAATMGLSDVVVIGNALRLRRWKAA